MSLNLFADGLGSVSADALNSFVQNGGLIASLRSFSANSGMVVYVIGGASADDGKQGSFYYNSTSTATDDGVNVIVPNGQTQGAWLRLGAIPTLTAYTVATLPVAGTAGRMAYVTDATTPTYLGALTGGGAIKTPVFDTGSIWVSF